MKCLTLNENLTLFTLSDENSQFDETLALTLSLILKAFICLTRFGLNRAIYSAEAANMDTILNVIFGGVYILILCAPFICMGALLAVSVYEIVSEIRSQRR